MEDNAEIGGFTVVSLAQWEQGHAGHFGTLKILLRLKEMGLRPSFSWVRPKIRECIPCQKFHQPQPTMEFGEWREAQRPGEIVGIDFMGALP